MMRQIELDKQGHLKDVEIFQDLSPEEVDARSKTILGNTPLLFAQIEYVRAVLEKAEARPLDAARMMVGNATQRISRFLHADEAGGMQEHG